MMTLTTRVMSLDGNAHHDQTEATPRVSGMSGVDS